MEETFENRLYTLRKKHSLNQEQLGVLLGVTKSVISDWENGKKFPTRKNLDKICEHLNTSISYLFGGSEVNNKDLLDLTGLDDNQKESLKIIIDGLKKNAKS